ncbi:MAG: AraC family transcriptional regulator [Deltaproteobacteria bacterium]|nr:AraC family transcriptional regulator [Deltaproteobacteria bacterium]
MRQIDAKNLDFVLNHPSGFRSRIETYILESGFIFCLTDLCSPFPFGVDCQNLSQTRGFGFNVLGPLEIEPFKGFAGTKIPPGQMVVFSTPSFDSYSSVMPAGRILRFSISHLNKEEFNDNEFDNLLSKSGLFKTNNYFLKSFPYSHDIVKIISEVSSCPHHGALRKIFLEAKALELFVQTVSKFVASGSAREEQKSSLSRQEAEKAMAAADMLIQDFDATPSLEELSKRVGMCRCRLIQAFKEVHGTTPFAYLKNYRLLKAKEMLLTNKVNITDVALAVGYSSLSHFTKAFAQKFDCLPSQCRYRKAIF